MKHYLFYIVFLGGMLLPYLGKFVYAQTASPPIRLAILYFENNSSTHKDELAPLSKGLCDMMIGDIMADSRITVIERTRLEEILHELKLTRDKAFDKATTQKIGKLLGVEYLVLGAYFDLLGKIRIDARIVKVETGEIIAATGMTGKEDEFDLLEHKLVINLTSLLFPPNERKTPQTDASPENPRQPKLTLRGAIKYGQALEKADAGDTPGATSLLRDIVEANPDFALAKQMLADFEK